MFVVTTQPGVYIINGASNPELYLVRGLTYVFANVPSGHPLIIKTTRGTTTTDAYSTGVTNNGVPGANVTFVVPMDAPDTLYYNCLYHAPFGGTLHITNAGAWDVGLFNN